MVKASDIKNALATGTKIGHLTWFDCEDAHITPSRLKTLFKQHGLNDDKYFPDNIKPKNAFQKACRKAMSESGKSSDTRRSIVKLIVDGLDKLVYGIVDLDVHEQTETIDPEFSAKVWLDKDKLTVHWDKPHPIATTIKTIFDTMCGEYITRDISRMIVRAMDKMCSVSLRKAGVIYFVPLAFEKDLVALRNVVNAIGECNMRIFALGHSDGNSMGVAQEAKSQINGKIEKMKEDIIDLKISIGESRVKGQQAQNSIDVRMRRFQEVKQRCQMLAGALQVKADDLMGNLSEVRDLLKKELEVEVAA